VPTLLWSRFTRKLIDDKIVTGLIATSSALFLATTGFTYASLVTWAGDVLLLVLGGGLGLVNAMIGWIIALIIITVIVRLIYHGFKWLHLVR